MSFTRLYGRVLGLLAAQKWLAAALVLANVALAVSQFAEPLLFGKVIDQLLSWTPDLGPLAKV